MATLTIDGKEHEFPDGTSLFKACREARGEALPHFCYHPDLSIAGVCRLCQVEVEGMPKLTIACNTGVRDGMVVHTRSEKVLKAVQNILEMHLINHPVDCSICDQSGECGLQNQYMKYGLYETQVDKKDKGLKFKAKVVGPRVIHDSERCVLCSRCVRFCREVTGTAELGIFNRGDRAVVDVAPGKELNNNYSLCTVDICPVGALTSRDFRFRKRAWMLKGTAGICPGCATGCNIRIDHEAERIYRIKPRRNEAVNGPWMCDIGRITYRSVHDEHRIGSPHLRINGVSEEATWPDLWKALQALGTGRGYALANPSQTLEELALFRNLAEVVCGNGNVDGALVGSGISVGDDLLLDADRTPNRNTLPLLGLAETTSAEAVEAIASATGPIIIYGSDPVRDAPALAEVLKSKAFIYLGTHHNRTSELATIIVPLSAWAEKDGIFINRKHRVQGFSRAVARPELAVEDWRFLSDWIVAAGGESPAEDLADIRMDLAKACNIRNGVDLAHLPAQGVSLSLADADQGGAK